MNAVARRNDLQRGLTHRQDLPHVVRWKALSRLRGCLTPLIHAAWQKDEKEIARLRRVIVVEAPIRKDGTIVLGTFGRGIGKFVIFELAEWKQLCDDVPQLQTTKFRVAAL